MADKSELLALARRLTKAQRQRLSLGVIVLRNRHDTRVALNLAKLGLVERGRHLNQFVWTAFGQQVRAIASEMDHG